MVFAVRPAFNKGNLRPVQFFGVFSSVVISLGLIPQYWEIYQHKEVVGISMTFIYIDWLGGVFSILSLVFKEKFDVIASLSYSLVVLLDGFIIIAYFILNPAANRRRRRLLLEGGSIAETTTVTNTPQTKPSDELPAHDVEKANIPDQVAL